MSVLHPSRVTRRLLKLASLGLAGLLAGLLTGCSSHSTAQVSANDTYLQTSSYTSASATASARSSVPAAHTHPCFAAPCHAQIQTVHARPLHHL